MIKDTNALFHNLILQDSNHRRLYSQNNFEYKKIWNIKDVCLFTGYSKGTVYNLTSKGMIPHRKKRGKLYFIPTEIQNWIDEGEL